MKKKRINKKGAVELSMTTIIVIVMGVTILSLGLFWIRGVFQDIGGITKGAFDRGEGEIGEIFGETEDPVAIIPKSIELEQGGTEEVDVIINNLGDIDGMPVKGSVQPKASAGKSVTKLACAFGDTMDSSSETYTLDSGQGVKIPLYLEDKGSVLGLYNCKVTISGTGFENAFAIVTIKVVKG